MTRTTWPAPTSPGRTVHFIGDLHFGSFHGDRRTKITADFLRPDVPEPAAHLSLGDCANTGQPAESAAAVTFLDSLPAPSFATVGNHDVEHGTLTGAQAAAALGMPALNYTVDLGFATLVVIGPEQSAWANGDNASVIITQATLNWLDAQLASITNGAVVCCHAPLYNTVLGWPDGPAQHTSTDLGFFVLGVNWEARNNGQRDAAIRDVLNAHDNVRLFVSAHTHSAMESTGIITTVNLGAHTIGHLNCSGIAYVGQYDAASARWGPIRTPFVTFRDDDIQIRWRDHGSGAWVGPGGQRVTTLAV